MALYQATNDALLNDCWHLKRIDCLAAWPYIQSSNIKIGIVDTGSLHHPDLDSQIVDGWAITQGDSYWAWDPDNYHGTEVSSCACAIGNNSVGVAGVAYRSKLIICKIIDENVGWASAADVAAGVDAAVNLGAKIINISSNVFYSVDATLWEACRRAYEDFGCIVVCAAGNDKVNVDTTRYFPPDAVVVGGSNIDDEKYFSVGTAFGSNYGTRIDFVAPAQEIWMADWYQEYNAWNGTSFAAPITCGVLDLIWNANPTLTNAQVIQIAKDTYSPLEGAAIYTYFPTSIGCPNAQKGVKKALSTVTANAGLIYPYISFGMKNRSAIVESGVAKLILTGTVKLDVGAYSSDTITNVTVKTNKGEIIYSGAPGIIDFNPGNYSFSALVVTATTAGSSSTITTPDVYNAIAYHYTPNDPNLMNCWQVFRVNATHAWTYSLGDALMKLGTVDTGLNSSQPEFAGRIAKNWNWATQTDGTVDIGFMVDYEYYYHGTACLAVAAATFNNGIGIAGITQLNPVVSVVDVADAEAPSTSYTFSGSVADCIDFGTKIFTSSTDYTYESTPGELSDAIDYAHAAGVPWFQAAMNNNSSVAGKIAGDIDVDVVVGAIDINDNRASFSNYGSWVDVVAPGVAVYGTTMPNTLAYGPIDGTSFATPITAGCGGLAWAMNTSLTYVELANIIKNNTDHVYGATFYNYFPSNVGCVNAAKAVLAAKASNPANAGEVYPYINFFKGKTNSLLNGLLVTSLSGDIDIELKGFSNDSITSVELWVGGTKRYDGPPITLSTTATNDGVNYAPIKVVAKTATNTTEHTYGDILVSDIAYSQVPGETSVIKGNGYDIQLKGNGGVTLPFHINE